MSEIIVFIVGGLVVIREFLRARNWLIAAIIVQEYFGLFAGKRTLAKFVDAKYCVTLGNQRRKEQKRIAEKAKRIRNNGR